MSKKKPLTKKELELGLASGQLAYKDPKSKHRKGYEIRLASGFEVSDSYPGNKDHPSPEGTISYDKHVDTSAYASVWEAIASEHYVQGGIPQWVADSLSTLDRSVYWQMVHYQFQWGGRANMSLKTLSRNLGVRYRSIQRSVHKLLDIGAIELIQKHTGRKTASYRVNLLSSLEKGKTVETTSESVETTSEDSKDDSADAQKTKPLKGRVARSPADAGRATPRKKKSQHLATIDEAQKIRAKSIAREEISAKPKLIRPFFPVEANNKKIEKALEIDLLASKWQAVKDLASISGEIDLETETFIPSAMADEDALFKLVQERLLREHFDVMNLPQAIDFILDSLLRMLTPKQKELETRLRNQRDEKERELKLQEAKRNKEREEKEKINREMQERLEIQKKEFAANLEFLENSRKFLLFLYPNIQENIDGWGSITIFLNELSGKELNKIENAEVRTQLYRLSTEIPQRVRGIARTSGIDRQIGEVHLERLYKQWIEGNDEWKMMASYP